MPTPIANQLQYNLPDPIGIDQLKRRNVLAERDQAIQEQNAAGYQNQLAMTQQGQQRNWMAQDQESKQQAFGQIGALAQQALQAGPNARQLVQQALQNPAYAQVFQQAGLNPAQIDLNSPTFEQDLQTWASLGPQKAQQEAYTLKPGEARYVGGKEIASVPVAEPQMTPYQQAQLGIDRQRLQLDRDKLKEVPVKDAQRLRKEFRTLPSVKDFETQLPILVSARKAPDNGYGDLQLIYSAGKILDPGSVVREGELGLAIAAGSPLERVIGTTRFSIGKGGRLTKPVREQLLGMLNERVLASRQAYDRDFEQFKQYAQEGGMASDAVVGKHPTSAYGKPAATAKKQGGWSIEPVSK